MRTTDQRMLLQGMLRTQYGNILSTVNQYDGLYYGVILDTDASNSSLASGYARFTIPAISGDAWGPVPYPGLVAPASGVTCVVGFDHIKNEPIIISYIGANPDVYADKPGYYGSYYSNTTQGIASTTTAYPMVLEGLDSQNGVLVSGSPKTKITVAHAGVYSFFWSGQFQNTAVSDQDVSVWVRKNGVDIPGSTGLVSIPSSHGGVSGHSIAGWNFFFNLDAGDYIELYWCATSTAVSLEYYAAGTAPTRPSTSSIVATLAQVAYNIAGGA